MRRAAGHHHRQRQRQRQRERLTSPLRLVPALAEPAFCQPLESAGCFAATGRGDMARVMRDDVAKYAALVKGANFRD